MNKLLALLLTLTLSPAFAATLIVDIEHPSKMNGVKIPQTGPTSLKAVRVEYGTCNGDKFGVWEGGKTKDLPITRIRFHEVEYRRTCTRARWIIKSGKVSQPSAVSIAGVSP